MDVSKDYTRVARLSGHLSTVSALDVFDDQNLFITCDEYGFLKSWDISTFRCIQNSRAPTRNYISRIVSLKNLNSFCTLSVRLHFFDFDTKEVNENRKLEFYYVRHLEFIQDMDTILVASNEDLTTLSLDSELIKTKINEDSHPD